jgi:hypothetical protein
MILFLFSKCQKKTILYFLSFIIILFFSNSVIFSSKALAQTYTPFDFILYKNNRYGIQMIYPSNWIYDEHCIPKGDIVDFFSIKINNIENNGGSATVSMQNITSNYDPKIYADKLVKSLSRLNHVANFTLINSNSITIDNKPAYKLEYILNYGSQAEFPKIESVEVWLINNNKFYHIDFQFIPNYASNLEPTIETMISSFKINEYSNSTIKNSQNNYILNTTANNLQLSDKFLNYTNPIYNISIQYPSKWQKIEQFNDFGESNNNVLQKTIVGFRAPQMSSLSLYREALVIDVDHLSNIHKDFSCEDNDLSYHAQVELFTARTQYPGFQLLDSEQTTLASHPAYKLIYTEKNRM